MKGLCRKAARLVVMWVDLFDHMVSTGYNLTSMSKARGVLVGSGLSAVRV